MPRSFEETGVVRAQARSVRSSARKARVVLEQIRGKRVADATAILTFSPRAVSRDIELVLRSAISNAEANHGLAAEDLVVDTATADEGITMKRWSPRARGRAMRIRKRTTHITVTLRPAADGTTAGRGTGRRAGTARATEAVAGLGATSVAPATTAAATPAPDAAPPADVTEAAAGLGAAEVADVGDEVDAVETATPAAAADQEDASADAPSEGARSDQAAEATPDTVSTDQAAEGDRETVDADLADAGADSTTTTPTTDDEG